MKILIISISYRLLNNKKRLSRMKVIILVVKMRKVRMIMRIVRNPKVVRRRVIRSDSLSWMIINR